MTAAKHSHLTRVALTRAIENKVERMDMVALLDLATALKVSVPVTANTVRKRGREPEANAVLPHKGHFLKGSGIGPVVSASEGSGLLDAITVDDGSVDWLESELLGAGELVSRLKISRGTLDNWRKANKVVALPKGLRNFVFPVRQFDRHRPVEGLDSINSIFSSPEEVWEWLVTPNRMTDGKAPIDKLHDGDLALVKSAAQGAFDYS